jgi:hypothetical protein
MSSSRRATGDINILALLDGQSSGRRLRARPVFWYGTAGVLACSLIVALAWLVRSATAPRHADVAGATAAVAHDAHTSPAPSGPAAIGATGSALERDVNAALAAEASAQPPASAHALAESAMPSPATAGGAVIVDLTGPTPPASIAIAPSVPAHGTASVATPRAQPSAVHHPAARPQPAYRTVPPHTPALAHAGTAPQRQKRAMPRTPPPTATVDTDVALISAILQHTGAPREAAAAADAATPACADKSCGPHMPSRQ